jgi:hypothetical protein
MVWKGDSSGRLAKSLITLIDQVDKAWPDRLRVSDGSVASSQHTAQNPTSDHERGADGVVEALDITHDPAHSVDTWELAETFRINRDPRIKYVISNGRIFAGHDGPSPWVWRKYTGANNHAKHVHVSVRKSLMDDTSPWELSPGGSYVSPAPEPPKPRGITADMRQRMMKVIMGYEGKIPPKIFIAPDGRPEIAGVTQKDHPQAYAALKSLLDQGKTAELTEAVISYYLTYTAPAQNWTDRAGPEFFLRDCILNRGPTGAAEILQDAVGVEVDGQVGPTTRGALAGFGSDAAIDRLRASRERYEDRKYPQRRSSGQWQGMLNRWNKAQTQAKAFQKEQGASGIGPEVITTTAVIVAGGGTAVAVKDSWSWFEIGMAAFSAAVAAIVIVMIVRKIRGK